MESTPGYGSIFIVHLQKGCTLFTEEELAQKQQEKQTESLIPDTVAFSDHMEEFSDTEQKELLIEGDDSLHTILLVEDNEELLQILNSLFSPTYRVLLARNGKEGLEKARAERPDIIVSDVMMPEMDGLELCSNIKKDIRYSHIPIILLTAKASEEHQLEGLETGADDYITKPFLPPELVLRVTAILKRTYRMEKEKTQEEHILRLGSHEVLFDYGIVRFQGNETSLTAKELALLLKLHENRGRIVTFDALCNAAWGDGYYGYENTLMVHIRHLREKN